ncbi:branched-chain amino acid aminotransferase 2 [Populus alba x Populus x berolinensis]|nr:branched-chain amino acid aminotransferase 2 [Populus alba x Populus x berolinensis]
MRRITHTIRGKSPSQSHSKKTDKRVRKKLKRKKEERMERSAVSGGLQPNYLLYPSRTSSSLPFSDHRTRLPNFSPPPSLSLKLQKQVSSCFKAVSPFKRGAAFSDTHSETLELADIDWDDLGFAYVPTDYMYTMKCTKGGNFSKGELQRFGNIELNPSAGVLNYGQGLFEGLKAYRKEDGNLLLFRPEENAMRMIMGAERMCMPSPTIDQFVDAVKATVLANKRWVPPPGKGSLYIRPLLMGSGAVLGLAPAPEYTFLIYVSPVGNYFKEGVAPIHLIVENELHRATPGGTGGVKTIGNYAAVLKAQSAAKARGFSDVLYLDCVHKKYLEEVSSCNIFVVKGNSISTPAIKGTILPGITRKSIIDVARSQGFQVEERPVTVDELLDADEVFCTGTAVVVSPVGSITYKGKRVSYGEEGFGAVAQQLYSVLTKLQMGLIEDKMNWTVELS